MKLQFALTGVAVGPLLRARNPDAIPKVTTAGSQGSGTLLIQNPDVVPKFSSEDFSEEAIRQTPCGGDDKSGQFDTPGDSGPPADSQGSGTLLIQNPDAIPKFSSEDFSEEAIRQTPCGGDNKSDKFDSPGGSGPTADSSGTLP